MQRIIIHVALLLSPLTAAAADDPTTTLWFDKPATRFQQSLPLGNGCHRLCTGRTAWPMCPWFEPRLTIHRT